jgi:hypothetical protein
VCGQCWSAIIWPMHNMTCLGDAPASFVRLIKNHIRLSTIETLIFISVGGGGQSEIFTSIKISEKFRLPS